MQYDKLSTLVKAQGISAYEAEGSTHYLVIKKHKNSKRWLGRSWSATSSDGWPKSSPVS